MRVQADSARAGKARSRAGVTAINGAAALAAALLVGLTVPATADDRPFDASRPLEIADQGVFSIPGRYVEVDKQTIMVGQMFVQYQVPKNRTRPYPVVMNHGGGQTASNFLSTPDVRRGCTPDRCGTTAPATGLERNACLVS